MTINEVVRQALREEHGGVIRESVRVVVRDLMGLRCSSDRGRPWERTEDRATDRNDYGRGGETRGPGRSRRRSPESVRAGARADAAKDWLRSRARRG